MITKEKLIKANKHLKKATELVKESKEAGDKFKSDEIQPLIDQVRDLKQKLVERLEKEETRLIKN